MATTLFRTVCNTSLFFYNSGGTKLRTFHTAATSYAARKGTRERARARKVKVEVKKVGFIPHNQRYKKSVQTIVNKHADDSHKKIQIDDVYPMRYFRWIIYTPEQAIDAHKEIQHPTMFNNPNALVYARVELNMEAVKKNRYVDNFTRICLIPNAFTRDEQRTILVFCKDQNIQKEAVDAGATIAGGPELVKKIQDGELKLADYEFVIAHPNILTELVPIRGLMKRKFPNLRAGTLDPNVGDLVKKFASGVQYKVAKDEHQNDYACVEIPIGRLNMVSKEIAQNLEELLKDVNSVRPNRDGLFVTRCLITSPPSPETLKIDPFVYINRTITTDKKNENDDDDDEEEEAAATV